MSNPVTIDADVLVSAFAPIDVEQQALAVVMVSVQRRGKARAYSVKKSSLSLRAARSSSQALSHPSSGSDN